jgi:fructan beta-fructosidase
MIHWQHLPIALYPDSLGLIFSGSVVVDHLNTSGLGSADDPVMVAIFTYHHEAGAKVGRNDFETQGIAYSADRGRTWKKYEGNPVLKNPGIRDFRDPKVFWFGADRKWVMVLAVADHIEIYSSPDLKQWSKLSEFGAADGSHGGVWECPDLFPLSVNGTEKWVLLVSINPGAPNGGSGTQYFVGHFDGTTFVNENEPATSLWLDYGRDNYAGVTWANVPASDGRRLFLGWMSNWDYAQTVPTEVWRSAMTLPRELTLRQTPTGVRLASTLVAEFQQLREGEPAVAEDVEVKVERVLPPAATASGLFEIRLLLDSVSAGNFSVELFNDLDERIRIVFDADQNQFSIDRNEAGPTTFSPKFAGVQYGARALGTFPTELVVVADHASVELFADGGLLAMTSLVFPGEPFTNARVVAASIKIKSVTVTPLKSIWRGKLAR